MSHTRVDLGEFSYSLLMFNSKFIEHCTVKALFSKEMGACAAVSCLRSPARGRGLHG